MRKTNLRLSAIYFLLLAVMLELKGCPRAATVFMILSGLPLFALGMKYPEEIP